jgi:hypothetical protein
MKSDLKCYSLDIERAETELKELKLHLKRRRDRKKGIVLFKVTFYVSKHKNLPLRDKTKNEQILNLSPKGQMYTMTSGRVPPQ